MDCGSEINLDRSLQEKNAKCDCSHDGPQCASLSPSPLAENLPSRDKALNCFRAGFSFRAAFAVGIAVEVQDVPSAQTQEIISQFVHFFLRVSDFRGFGSACHGKAFYRFRLMFANTLNLLSVNLPPCVTLRTQISSCCHTSRGSACPTGKPARCGNSQ